jgi:hypothetical protein
MMHLLILAIHLLATQTRAPGWSACRRGRILVAKAPVAHQRSRTATGSKSEFVRSPPPGSWITLGADERSSASRPEGAVEGTYRRDRRVQTPQPPRWLSRIAQEIARTFGIDINKDIVRQVLAKHYRPEAGTNGPSWLSFIGHVKDSLWSVDLFRCESILLRSHWGHGGDGRVHTPDHRLWR